MNQGPDPSKIKRRSDGKFDGYESSESGVTLPTVSGNALEANPTDAQIKGARMAEKLQQHLSEGTDVSVETHGETEIVMQIGDGEVTISRTAGIPVDVIGEEEPRQSVPLLLVDEHCDGASQRITSAHDTPAMEDYVLRRASEHYTAVKSGNTPERGPRHYPASDGLPESYGVDIHAQDDETKEFLRTFNDEFKEDYNVQVGTLGGGMEGIVVSSTDEVGDHGAYNVTVAPYGGGSLIESDRVWCVVGEYQDGDGTMVEDDEDLSDPKILNDREDYDAVLSAVSHRLEEARERAADEEPTHDQRTRPLEDQAS